MMIVLLFIVSLGIVGAKNATCQIWEISCSEHGEIQQAESTLLI